jgi:hypothetical protein
MSEPLKLVNHTPREFPYSRDPYIGDFAWPGPVGEAHYYSDYIRFWFDRLHLHRFRLEVRPSSNLVKPQSVKAKVDKVFIFLNGQMVPMLHKGNFKGYQYWYYDSPLRCIQRYWQYVKSCVNWSRHPWPVQKCVAA